MKLSEVLSRIDDLDDSLVIYAKRPFSDDSEIQLVTDDGGHPNDDSYHYLLELHLANEVIQVWREWNKRDPSLEEKVQAIIYYAENDAYID